MGERERTEDDRRAMSQRVVASLPLTDAKMAKGDGRRMVGYAAAWDQPIVGAGGWMPADTMFLRRGTFKKSLAERFGEVRPLFNHGHDPTIGEKPLGKPDVIREDSYGLWTETPLLDTSWNDDIIELLKAGAIDGMSLTWETLEWDFIDDDAVEVTQGRLFEYGPVTFPAGQGTSATLASVDRLPYAHDAHARAEGQAEGGRQVPPPTLAALTWRREAQPQLEQERRFLAEQRKRHEALARG